MIDFLIILVVLALAGFALGYMIARKKKGAKCIGCPYAKACGGKCNE